MNSRVCVDASLVIALLVPERFSKSCFELWGKWVAADIAAIAPQLLSYEITSVLYRKAVTNQVSFSDAKNALERYLSMDIAPVDTADLSSRTFELAEQFKRPNTYDSHYLALAEQLNCPFWTLDQRLYYATHESFGLINLVSE